MTPNSCLATCNDFSNPNIFTCCSISTVLYSCAFCGLSTTILTSSCSHSITNCLLHSVTLYADFSKGSCVLLNCTAFTLAALTTCITDDVTSCPLTINLSIFPPLHTASALLTISWVAVMTAYISLVYLGCADQSLRPSVVLFVKRVYFLIRVTYNFLLAVDATSNKIIQKVS
eukprot:NODE_625_length_5889_cov_0.576339.p3 type:complete len:173 gc:universal NODE_625_length_5889_cov_0.576339:2037-2555(+)